MRKILLSFLLVLIAPSAWAACANTNIGNGVTCVKQAINGGIFSTSNGTVSPGSNIVVGNLDIVFVSMANATVTISSVTCGTNTYTPTTHTPIVGTGVQVFIYKTVVTNACQTHTVNTSAGWTGDIIEEEYSGLSASPYDCDTTTGTGSSTSLATGTCAAQSGTASATATSNTNQAWAIIMAAFKTSSGTNNLLVAVGSQANGSTYTAGGSYTIRQQGSGTGHGIMVEDLTVAGAVAKVQRRR